MKQIRLGAPDEIIVDNFAGGGGASTGMELATGRIVKIAINHDPDAILMHKTNHPHTRHLQASVWDVDPVKECGGCPVGLAWFSPDCKHFSKAKGAALVDRNIRGLAWIVLRWAGTVRPRVIILENVEEFQTWGPVRRGKPVKKKAGQTFRRFISQLEGLGYTVEYRELVAADYGAPTTRKRFVLVARCDGRPVVWPERTHDKDGADGLPKWRAAAEVIDWTQPCYSIFATKEEIKSRYGVTVVRPLADNTMRRVIRGVDKFVIKAKTPYIVPWTVTNTCNSVGSQVTAPVHTVTTAGNQLLLSPALIQYHTEQSENVRGQSVAETLRTITASAGEFAEIRTEVRTYEPGADMGHWPEVRALLNRFCGYDLKENEVLTLDVGGTAYFVADIGLRMLTPRELYNAMGFPPDYIIDRDYTGRAYGKSKQVARCGNAVCPPMAEAVVRANLPEWCGKKLRTMEELGKAVSA